MKKNAITKWIKNKHKSPLTNQRLDNKILSNNITVQILLINICARAIDNNVDTVSSTTEVDILSVGYASQQESFIANTSIPIK